MSARKFVAKTISEKIARIKFVSVKFQRKMFTRESAKVIGARIAQESIFAFFVKKNLALITVRRKTISICERKPSNIYS